ncbi:hypothetical protein COZ13_07235 [Candidatus Desantisbacteria bacterium CG_4_10_14_3_um_filter_40_18]|uniref:Uncharacterized protein n=2 Tax=unclassified Candidatus Desantisiibacteriota TaxID=3106372 RepID=A0A2M7P0E5_9BACT|nr:MAG: hypothetical protein COX18_00005 [Candidatus Desantisbacteria bacterium CG23_combo_of_CG06-09_8_20_14_all_40_23]PIY19077.1 MAG: hypothetical protein COZ13_07235 [Candidatus Desantisbacteria bacterium CG_4_10_14_3_um_filter_40_18]
MAKRKTAREQLEDAKGLPKVVATPKGVMLVPKPLDVDALIRRVERGKLVTVDQIRKRLAKDAETEYTCPLCTGIFLRIAAEASEEDLVDGKTPAPYWRVVKSDGSLNEKFPDGAKWQTSRLIEEGHTIEPGKGKKPPRVKDFEKFIQEI